MSSEIKVITAEGVTFRYGRGDVPPVLQGLSLPMQRGQLVALVGANGSGKSTLLRLLAGVLWPEGGVVRADRTPVHDLTPAAASRTMAYVAQDNPATFAFTVTELVGLGISGLAKVELPTQQQRLQEALEQFDLAPLAGRSLASLSGGQRQRAHLARGWVQRTPFLLLDEPTSHQDIGHQARIMALLRAGAEEKDTRRGVVVAIHDLNLAVAWAHRLVLLHNGRIVADGTPPAAALIPDVLSAMYGLAIEVTSVGEHGALWVRPRHPTI